MKPTRWQTKNRGNLNAYAGSNPLGFTDPLGLYLPEWHRLFTLQGALNAGFAPYVAADLAEAVVAVDFLPGSQEVPQARWHGMCSPRDVGIPGHCEQRWKQYIDEQLRKCTMEGLARAIHASQDSFPRGHSGVKPYHGFLRLPPSHLYYDKFPTPSERAKVPADTENLIRQFNELCRCER